LRSVVNGFGSLATSSLGKITAIVSSALTICQSLPQFVKVYRLKDNRRSNAGARRDSQHIVHGIRQWQALVDVAAHGLAFLVY
jgi:hypothetical protein